MKRSTDLAKLLVGRRIVGVNIRKFRDGRGGWAQDPRILLDSGLELYFCVQETEDGGYGIRIGVTRIPRPRGSTRNAGMLPGATA